MARTVVDQNMIIKINNTYLKLKTYAATARELGISASTVSKYVIKDYKPVEMDNIKRFDYESYRTPARGHLFIEPDMSEVLILTEKEKEELKELWKELTI